jgi:hypothetical protein
MIKRRNIAIATGSDLPDSDIDLPDTLYHYTDINGLRGIFEDGEIWATNSLFLNDTTELQLGIAVVIAKLAEQLAALWQEEPRPSGGTSNVIKLNVTHLIATEKSTGILTERCRGVSPPVHRELKAEDHRGRSDLIGQTEESMAKLLKPREEVKKAIVARIRAGKDLTAKAEIAESTGGYEDWLFTFAKWRDATADELTSFWEASWNRPTES